MTNYYDNDKILDVACDLNEYINMSIGIVNILEFLEIDICASPLIYLNASKRSINNRIYINCNLFDTNELIEISV